ncbi:hypothetical protein RSOL_312520 [Rhizoctonia solani AG-3 Rhs1AP]|uniref:Uncharacterized protein n=1 Tax=Rhizoctonia solani AG-3 Rhs1AP TaxID=1086054 RepID=A0A0A1UKK9_9AGAM|nr:hypothetical protein RSOL_312520 [Rhizoctonia solani AG-3 Rhs1AP]
MLSIIRHRWDVAQCMRCV